jgi:hypothetical protein
MNWSRTRLHSSHRTFPLADYRTLIIRYVLLIQSHLLKQHSSDLLVEFEVDYLLHFLVWLINHSLISISSPCTSIFVWLLRSILWYSLTWAFQYLTCYYETMNLIRNTQKIVDRFQDFNFIKHALLVSSLQLFPLQPREFSRWQKDSQTNNTRHVRMML